MSQEIRDLVDRRWAEYGIPAHEACRGRSEWPRQALAAAGTSLTHGRRAGVESNELESHGDRDLSEHDTEQPHTAVSEPVADRLRDRHRVRPRRARGELGRGRRRRRHRLDLRLPLDPRPHDRRPRRRLPAVEPEARPRRAVPAPLAAEDEAALAADVRRGVEAYPRSTFLSAATLGLGAVIGGIVTVPVLGFTVLPAFTNQRKQNVELGPLEDFPGGQLHHRHLPRGPRGRRGEQADDVRSQQRPARRTSPASRSSSRAASTSAARCSRTAPSSDDAKKTVGEQSTSCSPRRSRPASAARATAASTTPRATARPARPSARSTARSSRSSTASSGSASSTASATVEGTGASARIRRYGHTNPGVHVDGIAAWLYPIEVPTSSG